jgi:membrane protease YdiL (CAAX protease family)
VKQRVLAVIEALLTLLAAGLLSMVLMAVVVMAYWTIVEQRPLAEIPWLQSMVPAEPGEPLPEIDLPGATAVIIIGLTTQALIFAGVGFGMGRWRIRAAGPPAATPGRAVGLGIACGLVAIVGTMVISTVMTLLGIEVREQSWVLALVQADPGILWLLMPWTVVVGPIAEEVFFRFYLFRFLSQYVGPGFGYVASATTFALIHFHLPALPLYLFYGLLLAWVYRRTGRLLAPIVTHMFINLISTILLVLTGGEIPV